MFNGLVILKNLDLFKRLIAIISLFPLKSGIELNDDTCISDAIDLFSSIVLERLLASLSDEFPNINFEDLNTKSTINDIYEILISNKENKLSHISENKQNEIIYEPSYKNIFNENSIKDYSFNIKSVGIDIESKESIPEDIFSIKKSSLRKRLFCESEILHAITKPDPFITLVGIFAAKEAIIKSLSSTKKITFNEINIVYKNNGMPFALINKKSFKSSISISHNKDIAIAICII